MRLATLAPSAVLHAIDRVRTRRFLALTGPPTIEYVRRNGLEVQHGPLAGMRYIEGLEGHSGDLVAKLVGSYEHELHHVLAEWIAARYEKVIDVGCAEGYYAVGLAVAMPQTEVYAFDIDASARRLCGKLATLNSVSDRVHVEGECTHSRLESFPASGVALLADCEGAERALLDPDASPKLRRWPILVEIHDFIDPAIGTALYGRFSPTHDVEIIEGTERTAVGPGELAFMTARERRAVLSEHRPAMMRWAYMRPRA